MKKITIGIIAHVDSGKTTLSEALLYLTGTIRNFGRVDKGASFLDNDSMERRRGITIYSKQARFSYGDTQFILIDTPGHADFSAEMERTLQILDYVVLLISAADGIKGRTHELWNLLAHYKMPVFVFFNKMDQATADREMLLNAFRAGLSQDGVDFTDVSDQLFGSGQPSPSGTALDDFYDSVAMCDENAMESCLETGSVPPEMISRLIFDRKLFPCFFGSALKQSGITGLLSALDKLTSEPVYPEAFGARAYKILRDPDGNRLTLMKITGGVLKNRSMLPDGNENASKINQIRLYNGTKYELVNEAYAGEVCAVTGLKESFAGQGFGMESGTVPALMTPILSYTVILPDTEDPVKVYPYFKQIEEENPELKSVWDEARKEISVCVMGKVQIEILSETVRERFGLEVSFDTGQVMYRETICGPVIGAGHFEPLRHYAEAVLLMEADPENFLPDLIVLIECLGECGLGMVVYCLVVFFFLVCDI